jgi:hypothetical protein
MFLINNFYILGFLIKFPNHIKIITYTNIYTVPVKYILFAYTAANGLTNLTIEYFSKKGIK